MDETAGDSALSGLVHENEQLMNAEIAILSVLQAQNVPLYMQELLMYGSPRLSVPPKTVKAIAKRLIEMLNKEPKNV